MIEKPQRSHDEFYLKDDRYFKNPKYATGFLKKLLEKYRDDPTIDFWDIGCANGALVEYISKKFTDWKMVGSDIRSDSIKSASQRVKNCSFFVDNIEEPHQTNFKTKIINCSGVFSIFDDPKNFLEQILSRCKEKGHIFIHSIFNPYDVDIILRYRDNTNSDLMTEPINETGWNIFSIKFISKLIDDLPNVDSFKFHKISFPENINVSMDPNDPLRSWNVKFNHENPFMNGLTFIQNQYYLEINLK